MLENLPFDRKDASGTDRSTEEQSTQSHPHLIILQDPGQLYSESLEIRTIDFRGCTARANQQADLIYGSSYSTVVVASHFRTNAVA